MADEVLHSGRLLPFEWRGGNFGEDYPAAHEPDLGLLVLV